MKHVLLALGLVPALAFAEPTTWNVDPSHTQTNFTVRHLAISNVRGEFRSTKGVLKLDEKDPAKSSVEATIDAGTINTREDQRDAHLRSPDFLDVATYPTITFRSTKVEKAGKGYRVRGELTLHGVTRPVVLEVSDLTPAMKDPMGMDRRGVRAATKISRKDFGLEWNKMVEATPVVGDEIRIEIDAEMVKQPAEGAKPVEASREPAAAAKAN
ncbi:YceI family protein [Anaeromyxobacter terrae]|uniref:YceI family protein n=1 Tax=Anaeromyxobacter terrae TaxID=2925406 RepID=UPI001F584ECF|nr:YceI family protein [Anaeromyxobacter sp. SG22]